jgi:fumarate hydratase class II
MHVAAAEEMVHRLIPAVTKLRNALAEKQAEFDDIVKIGRTHLMDAVPITFGQEFSGFAACLTQGAEDVETASRQLQELNLGATAVGTGINTSAGYSSARRFGIHGLI